MVPIADCKKILCSNGARYTDEEVKRLREELYQLGYIDYDLSQKRHEEAAAKPTGTDLLPRLDG